MEKKALKQLNMVSRLPKFSSRSSGTTTSPLPQGSGLPVPSYECKGGPVGRQNGLTQVRSLNWRKCEEETGNNVQCSRSLDEETSATIDSDSPLMVTKKLSPAAVVKCKSAVSTAQCRSIPQPTKTVSRMTTPKRLSTGNTIYNGMGTLNGASSGNERSSGSGLGHVSQQKSLQSKLSLSSDRIKSTSKESIERSQSFTYFKRGASHTDPPMTRSFSFNKATDLANKLPRPLAPSPVPRSPLNQPNPVLSKGKVDKFGFTKPSLTASGNILPVATIKKSLLPSFSGNKTSVLSYKLTRPSLNKHPRPVLPAPVQKEAELSEDVQTLTLSAETSSDLTNNTDSTETTPTENEITPNMTPIEVKEFEVSVGSSLEIFEDMSLSSSSSVEHNDSEEYMDDFDNLGNGGETLFLPVHKDGLDHLGLCEDENGLVTKCNEDSSMTNLHAFLSETVDWEGMGLTGGKDRFEHDSSSPVGDFPHGSSLDLSPSDSSGGTYMWDEEGMEALGGSGHPCGSFGSDLNSMDILNKLENVESCDLEDDDLMLDLDLSVDASFHSDTDEMSSYEWSEKEGRPTQRRRWQQHRGMCENRTGLLQSFDGFRGHGLERSRSDHVTLDDLTLNLVAQDCSSVKEQLLQLMTLLQMETECSVEETSEALTPQSTDQSLLDEKVALLLKEIEELRNELRSKDRMIAELSQQLSSPVEDIQCHCLDGLDGNKLSLEHQDKDTQTLWKPHNLQILQTPRFIPNKLDDHDGLSRPTCKDASCNSLDANPGNHPLTPQPSSSDLQNPIAAASTPNCIAPTVFISADSTAASSSKTFQSSEPAELGLTSSRLKINEPANLPASASFCCKLENGTQKLPFKRSSFSSPQPPSYIKRASTLIKPQEVQRVSVFTGALGRLGATGPPRTRHQPLSAPGLHYINPSQQTSMHTTNLETKCNRQNQEDRQSLFLRKIESSLPRSHASLQPKHSRLPKPQSYSAQPIPAAQKGQTITSPDIPSHMLSQ
ncbi:serine-rich coiled-coil domain-containing protein 2 isoform X1 [Danio rerio]|uniref:Serine-rich coiled-coil domain-containing protein 2 isoform X1 n=1 Tax=Danio rerio TaxID=7955 RepID=A0A8M9QJ31_DANRE|nr:serine-rich coiled-coil domain-containing protein 2-like isoform X1 [Danio rerio]|eukprot:XP_021335946.1 serine-rich coiled-coil domain-containing protein 2-like isoform X1 [Danio rerio]